MAGPWDVCVECLFLRSPERVPFRTPSACAKRATYPDPPPVILFPESIATQSAYAEALLPGSTPARNVSRYWGPPRGPPIHNKARYMGLCGRLNRPLGQPQPNVTGLVRTKKEKQDIKICCCYRAQVFVQFPPVREEAIADPYRRKIQCRCDFPFSSFS